MLAAGLCLILGDSNAGGVARQVPQCEAVTRKNATSTAVLAMAPADRGYQRVIVSTGGPDRKRHPLPENLASIRARYPQAKFTWLAPRRGFNALAVSDFAKAHNDGLIKLGDFPSRDSTHPDNYAAVAAQLTP